MVAIADTSTAQRFTPRKCMEPPPNYQLRCTDLSAVSVPDGTGRFVVIPFAPDGVSRSFAVNGQTEVIAERKAKACGTNVPVVWGGSGQLRLTRPARAAVGRRAVESVP